MTEASASVCLILATALVGERAGGSLQELTTSGVLAGDGKHQKRRKATAPRFYE